MKDRIKAVMAKAFQVPESDITEHSDMDSVENWDSMNHMQMILFLEREFGITIPDEIVGNMTNFKLIHEAILKYYEPAPANS